MVIMVFPSSANSVTRDKAPPSFFLGEKRGSARNLKAEQARMVMYGS